MIAGWSAYLAAVVAIISYAALFVFFAVGGVFGPINDAASVVQMIFMLPVALALYFLFRPLSPLISLAALVSAMVAMVGIAILQALLVLRRVRYEQTLLPVLTLGGILGVWWILIGVQSLIGGMLPNGLRWVSIAVGLSAIILVVGFRSGGERHPLAAIGFLTNAILVPIWLFWIGRLLLPGNASLVKQWIHVSA
jgi:hypothetical protein